MLGRAVMDGEGSGPDNLEAMLVESPVDRLWASAMSDMVEDLRSLALQCRGLAVVAETPELARTLLQAANDYDHAAEQIGERDSSGSPAEGCSAAK